jgi:hypothetical protein
VSCVGELRELPGGQGPKGVARESGCVAWQAPLRECAHGGASTQTPGIRGTARSSGMNRNACQSASSPRDESCGSALCRRPLPEGGGKIMANSENQMCVPAAVYNKGATVRLSVESFCRVRSLISPGGQLMGLGWRTLGRCVRIFNELEPKIPENKDRSLSFVSLYTKSRLHFGR